MSTAAKTVVHVDTARDRNKPVVGRQLLRRLSGRVFIGAAIAAAGIPLAWANSAPPARLILVFVLGFLAFSLSLAILFGGALLGEYSRKRQLAEKYGFDLRFGLDTYQRRIVRVESPPPDLSRRIEQALQAIAEDARAQQTDGERFEANLARKGKRKRCRVTVQLGPEDNGARTLTVESRLTEPLGFNDLGQNIINVEEFQRALVRLLGAEQRSLSEAPNHPAVGPSRN
jgi:hypothetical protein